MNRPLVFTCGFFFRGYFDREGLRFMWVPLFAHSSTTAENIKEFVHSQLERHDETHASDGPHGSMPRGGKEGHPPVPPQTIQGIDKFSIRKA